MEIFTSNQALELLAFKPLLTKEDEAYLKLTVILDWDNLSPDRKETLVTLDKLELLSIMSRKEEFFIQ